MIDRRPDGTGVTGTEGVETETGTGGGTGGTEKQEEVNCTHLNSVDGHHIVSFFSNCAVA